MLFGNLLLDKRYSIVIEILGFVENPVQSILPS